MLDIYAGRTKRLKCIKVFYGRNNNVNLAIGLIGHLTVVYPEIFNSQGKLGTKPDLNV